MRLQPATVKCNACGKEFEAQIVVDCTIKTFSTALKEEVRCPSGCNQFKKLALVKTGEAKQ